MAVRIIVGDCREKMAEMEPASVDAIVCDPPYGLEFMGKGWDKLDGWRDGGGFSKPGIGDRATAWTSYGSETANPTCEQCGGRLRGVKKCCCEKPNWKVRGESFDREGRAVERSRSMQKWHEAWCVEAYRVLKPGGHLLAFGGTRTHHRLMVAIEDAGFEIRDCLMWLYGSGFPKSLDVSKAIDKAAGALQNEGVGFTVAGFSHNPKLLTTAPSRGYVPPAPATEAAREWDGWGTALKPAWEPIVMARKPLAGTVAANVQAFGTGALNIDGCRIGGGGQLRWSQPRDMGYMGGVDSEGVATANTLGRWPANLVLDEDAAAMLDAQSGESRSTIGKPRKSQQPGNGYGMTHTGAEYADTGGASRFFYTAKASRAERNKGLDGLRKDNVPDHNLLASGFRTDPRSANGGYENKPAPPAANHHPTVKPLDLMQWLVRLVTPKGGTVLDPFCGSGSTLVAADREGFDAIGIELDPEYAEIARRRFVGDAPLFAEVLL
jgi:DNA modification methylase